MQIVHLTKYLEPSYGGVERAAFEMALAGQHLGASVDLIGTLAAKTRDPELQQIRSVSPMPSVSFGNIPLVPNLLFLDTHLPPSAIVHLHIPNPFTTLAILNKSRVLREQRNISIVPVVHATILRGGRLGKLWEKVVWKELFEQSDKIIVSSPQMAKLSSVFDPFQHKIEILPFAIKAPPNYSPYKGLNGPVLKLVSIGRLVPYKGFDDLISACSKLTFPFELKIIGNGPNRDRLIAMIHRLKLTKQITILSDVDDTQKYQHLQDSDVFVLASRSNAETFGIAIAEALSMGKPVVTTSLDSGVAFLARNGACGAVAAPKSSASLAAAISQLQQDPARLLKAGQMNREFWEQELTRRIYQKRYAAIIHSILSKQSKKVA